MRSIFTKFSILLLPVILLFTTNACHIDRLNNKGDLKLIQEKSFKIASGKTLIVEAEPGDVTIDSWDKDEVIIKIFGNKKTKEKIDFDFNGSEDFVEVKAERHGSFFSLFSGLSLRLEVTVPENFNSKISTSGGDIRIADVEGNNQLKTSGGDVLAAQIIGELKISTSGGDIIVKRLKGDSEVSTSGGDIKAEDFYGNLKASTSGGDVYLYGNDGEVIAKTSGGDIYLEYKGENRGINLITSGGDIRVKLPKDFNALANLYSSGGDVDCNLRTGNVEEISSSKFKAELNNGGEKLNVKTSGGDILITEK